MNTKPIIFLDMDGVLNNDEALMLSTEGVFPPGNRSFMTIDCECVRLFRELVEATNSDIVLSSTWRSSKMDHPNWDDETGNGTVIRALKFANWDARKYFIGNTANVEIDSHSRGEEIDHWIDNHPYRFTRGVTPYLILDDHQDFTPEQKKHAVFTAKHIGLTQKDVRLALKVIQSQMK